VSENDRFALSNGIGASAVFLCTTRDNGGRIARSFIKPLDVEGSAGREVAVRNCGAPCPTQRAAYRSCRCWISLSPRGGE